MQTAEFNHLESTFLNMDRRPDTWSVQVEVRVSGRIEEDRLRDSIRYATEKHPIARARIQPYGEGAVRYFWDIPEQIDHLPLTVYDARTDKDVAAHRSRLQSIQVPLSLSPGFMIYLVHHPKGDWLMINVNHTMGDGLSTFRIIQSIVRHYAGEPDPVPDLDPLSVRDLKKLAGSKTLTQRIERIRLLLDHLDKARNPPTRIKGRGVEVKHPDTLPGYGFELLAFSPKETKQFMARRVKPATVNDMLLAGLALTIKQWNAQHGARNGRTSIMMPVNLRPEDWWFEVVTNFSSYVSVSLPASAQTDFAATTRVVCDQTTQFKEAGAAGVLIDLLELPKLFPAVLKARLKELFPLFAGSLMETTILSNLGRLATSPSMGDAGRITDLYFTPPAPMPAGVSVGAASMEDRMFLTVRYRLAHFDAAAAKEFGALYRQVLLIG